MNRGVLESSPVQQLMAPGNPNWWNVSGGMRPPPPLMSHQHGPLPPQMTPNNYVRPQMMMPTLLPPFMPYPATSSSSSTSLPNNPNLSSWLESNDLPPESWSLSQLLLGGLMMGEEERLEMMNHHHDEQQHHNFQGKMRLENWEEQVLSHQQASMGIDDIKQESNIINNTNGYLIPSPNSPPNKSCVTTTTTTSLNSNDDNNNNNNNNNSMLDFSSNHNGLNLSEGRHIPPDRSSECNSLQIGGSTNKKPRLQPSQPTLKVRKEKLGGRIAALHQLVSPFGKTDTASVLSEAIGYIRFLQSQIEALSHPYFGTTASGNMRHQQHLQGDRSCLFPEDPGQLVNDQHMKKRVASSSSTETQNANEETKKDLRSRGLCLVPISCTLQVGSDNGADYWAPALGSAGFI